MELLSINFLHNLEDTEKHDLYVLSLDIIKEILNINLDDKDEKKVEESEDNEKGEDNTGIYWMKLKIIYVIIIYLIMILFQKK